MDSNSRAHGTRELSLPQHGLCFSYTETAVSPLGDAVTCCSDSNDHSLRSGGFHYFLWVLTADCQGSNSTWQFLTTQKRITGGKHMNYFCVYICAQSCTTANSQELAMPLHPFMILSVISITYPAYFSKMVSLSHRPTHPYPLNFDPQLHHSQACLSFFNSKMGMEMPLPTQWPSYLPNLSRADHFLPRGHPSETVRGKALSGRQRRRPVSQAAPLFPGTLKFAQNVKRSPLKVLWIVHVENIDRWVPVCKPEWPLPWSPTVNYKLMIFEIMRNTGASKKGLCIPINSNIHHYNVCQECRLPSPLLRAVRTGQTVCIRKQYFTVPNPSCRCFMRFLRYLPCSHLEDSPLCC